MQMRHRILGLLFAGALLASGRAEALLIDDFNSAIPTNGACVAANLGNALQGSCVLVNSPTGAAAVPTAVSGIAAFGGIAGTRQLSIFNHTPADGFAAAGINPSGAGLGGQLIYNNNANASTAIQLDWKVADYVPGGGTGKDLVVTPSIDDSYLAWRVIKEDIPLLVTILLEDSDGTKAGNSFFKLPSSFVINGVSFDCSTGSLVCVQLQSAGLPGNLYHGLTFFDNAMDTDDPANPIAGFGFYNDPYLDGGNTAYLGPNVNPDTSASANMGLAPSGGVAGLNLHSITRIRVILETDGTGIASPSLNLQEDCFSTTALLNPLNADLCPTSTVVPEPSTLLFMGTGLLGLGLASIRSRLLRRRRQG